MKMEGEKRSKRKEKEGKVVKISGDKSVLVEVTRRVRHPVYGKIVKKRKKFMVHDDDNTAQIGDSVTFVESRPLSRRKRWRIMKVGKSEVRKEAK